ncbi:YdhR family protein [Streptacidiphilus sp. 4-A2]|nr:YdhR family protein [Streptacidiphilus sp. 4-A2]
MHAVIAWWDLTESGQSAESLRQVLRDEALPHFAQMPGLRVKFWISDPQTQRWGAVFLWESAEAAAAATPSRIGALIGYPPVFSSAFEVEAVTEGLFGDPALAGRGLAFGG